MDKKYDISTSAVIINIILCIVYLTYAMMVKGDVGPGTTAGIFVSSLAGGLMAVLAIPFVVGGILGVLFGERSRPRIWFCLVMWLMIYLSYKGLAEQSRMFDGPSIR
jgi:hypothetical protein